MTLKEQISKCFNECTEVGECYSLIVDEKHSLFILIQEDKGFDNGDLEYFSELNNVSDGTFEPCATFNATCPIGDLYALENAIIKYLECNEIYAGAEGVEYDS